MNAFFKSKLQSFNRTIFGIETRLSACRCAGFKLLIAPFLELKHGMTVSDIASMHLLIAPFLELKQRNHIDITQIASVF